MTNSEQGRDLKWLVEQFNTMENDLDLVNWTIHGYQPWVDLKARLYERAKTGGLGLMSKAHPNLISANQRSPILDPGQINDFVKQRNQPKQMTKLLPRSRVAIKPSGRFAANGTDLYTECVAEAFRNASFELEDKTPDSGTLEVDPRQNLGWVNLAVQQAMKGSPTERYKLKKRDRQKASELSKYFEHHFLADPNNMENHLAFFVRYMNLYSRSVADYLRKQRVKNLILVGSVGRAPLVHGAQMSGATVIELQHGVINKYHLGYSWPGVKPTVGIPDAILTYGNYWSDVTPLAMKSYITGASWLPTDQSTFDKQDKLVLVTSQGPIGEKLFRFISNSARLLSGYSFIFQLHPSENPSTYQKLAKDFDVPKNLEISESKPGKVYELMKQAEFSVGVSSTTLFEGMAMGCKTLVVNLASSEYLEDAVNQGDALMVQSPEEFADRITEAPACGDPKKYFATPLAGKELKKAILSL